MNNHPLNDKVVLITGASSGIGRATAIAAAKRGARVVLLARSRLKLERVAAEIRQFSNRVIVAVADVSSEHQVKQAVQRVVARFGRIDVLFNNAGVSRVGRTDAPQFVDDARHMFEVDYLGTVRVTQQVVPIMRRQGHGQILNMSSVVGRKAFPSFGAYSSVMHAIVGYTDALRQELAPDRIEVSIIHPALTQTPLLADASPQDMPPVFSRFTPISAQKVASAVIDGLRRRTPRIVVPAQPKIVMLAQALSPRLGDLFVRLMQTRWLPRLLRTYRGGRTYVHGDRSTAQTRQHTGAPPPTLAA